MQKKGYCIYFMLANFRNIILEDTLFLVRSNWTSADRLINKKLEYFSLIIRNLYTQQFFNIQISQFKQNNSIFPIVQTTLS